MDWNTLKPLLDAKLDPKHVKKGGGSFGPKGDFLEGWFVIQEANRIFGHGGWSYTIDLRQDDLREVQKNGKPQWQAAYTCICTVTVDGVVRQDVGFGSGFASGIGDAIEGATKESATDALKRCLRTFGNPFGLALYDKTRENVGVDLPPFDPAAASQRILLGVAKRNTVEKLNEFYREEKGTLSDMLAADPATHTLVMAAFKEAKAKLNVPAPSPEMAEADDLRGTL